LEDAMTVEDSEANARACVCPGCPSYDACAAGHGETLYCARGKSACDLAENGCICDECPVWGDYGLMDMYFCTNGPAA
jgi:hypothetical protein